MATTTFVDQSTVIEAAWLNDIDNACYLLLDAAAGTAAAARTALGFGLATDSNFLVGDGTDFVAESGSTARTSLGAGGLVDDNAWTGSNSGAFVELTDGATVAVDFALANNFYVTVTANRTIGAPSNKVAGQAGVIVVEQDAGGTNVTTFHADWDFGDTGNPIPDTTGNKKAVIAYFVDWDSVVVSAFVGDF